MDRLKFCKALLEDHYVLEDRYKNYIYKKNYETFGKEKCLIFAIEEMSELQKELTKVLRGEGDRYGVLEEMADVLISMEYIRMAMGFDYDDLTDAEDVKICEVIDKKFDYLKERMRIYEGVEPDDK